MRCAEPSPADRPGRRALIALAPALLGGCVSPSAQEAARLLADIDAGSFPSALKAATPAPERRMIGLRVGGRGQVADLYRPRQAVGGRLVLVPGFTEHGKDDARLVELATSLARARFMVLVPDLAGARALRVRLEDARAIADAAIYLAAIETPSQAVGVVAISYAAGLAVLASLERDARPAIGHIVGVGAYHDTLALARFIAADNRAGTASAQLLPAAKAMFLASHAALLDDIGDRALLEALAERRRINPGAAEADLRSRLGPEGRSLLALIDNDEPQYVDHLVARLPPRVRWFLTALSLRGRDLAHLAGRLILIHGREDRVIPWTESRDLAAAVPGSELFLIDGFTHIDPRDVGLAGRWQLIGAVQAVLRRRRS